MANRIVILMSALAVAALSACSSGTPQLMNLRNTEAGPDEFAIVPTRQLEIPQDLSTLPPPTPRGTNRADPTPEADAIAALGGNINAGPSGNGGLLAYSTRFGVSDGIRDTLAAEDTEFRRRNDGRLLERIFGSNVYFRAYRREALDRYEELERLRRAGVNTPSAPPPDAADGS